MDTALRKTQRIAAIDVGSSSITCAIAKVYKDTLHIISTGTHPTRGVKKGIIVDMEAATTSMAHALQKAETTAQYTVKSAFTNVSGAHLLSEKVNVSLDIDSHEIDQEHITHILSTTTQNYRSQIYDIIHTIPLSYSVDDNDGITDPIGMYGLKLKGSLHVVTGSKSPTQNIIKCLKHCHIQTSGLATSAIASAEATLVPDEMKLGACVIDIGSETTDIVIYLNGMPVFVATIPIGGTHITRDLSQGLSTPFDEAERIKILHSAAHNTRDLQTTTINVPQITGGTIERSITVNRSVIAHIVQARLEEIFELIKNQFLQNSIDDTMNRRIVITGGTSQIPGIKELATQMFNRQVRLGQPIGFKDLPASLKNPAFSTCFGLLKVQTCMPYDHIFTPDAQSYWKKTCQWLRGAFSQAKE